MNELLESCIDNAVQAVVFHSLYVHRYERLDIVVSLADADQS